MVGGEVLMSYLPAKGIVDDINSLVSDVRSGVNTAKKYGAKAATLVAPAKAILDDPALPEVVSLVMELKAIKAREKKSLGSLGGTSLGDIGLKGIVQPLRYYVGYKKNPAMGMLVIAAIFAAPLALGYVLGKRR